MFAASMRVFQSILKELVLDASPFYLDPSRKCYSQECLREGQAGRFCNSVELLCLHSCVRPFFGLELKSRLLTVISLCACSGLILSFPNDNFQAHKTRFITVLELSYKLCIY